jgi:hypothetical protein
LPPVQILLLFVFGLVCNAGNAQCYIDPFTGQRICSRSGASSQSPAVDSAAHCRITVADGTKGSGTLVDRSESVGLVLTCAHLFETSKSQIVVSFANGRRFGANLVELDKANDLAAVEIRRPDVAPLSVCDEEPSGTLTACGYGPNDVFRAIRGAITGHPTAAGASYPSTTITGAVRPGDSGGAVLNTRGQLVGVVWGQRDCQTYATCGRAVCEFLQRIRNRHVANRNEVVAVSPTSPQPQAPSPSFDWQTWTKELDTRIRALDAKKQDKGDYVQPGDLNRYLKVEDAAKITDQFAPRFEIENKLKTVVAEFQSARTVIESVRQHVEQIAGDRASILSGISIGKYTAAALGLSGPLAAAVVIAGGLFGRRIKSRVQRLESAIGIAQSGSKGTLPLPEPRPIAVDSPPLPQRTVPETHYVPVEKDSFAKAHQWASEHVARKYPGATEVLQTQDSLIKQYLASK